MPARPGGGRRSRRSAPPTPWSACHRVRASDRRTPRLPMPRRGSSPARDRRHRLRPGPRRRRRRLTTRPRSSAAPSACRRSPRAPRWCSTGRRGRRRRRIARRRPCRRPVGPSRVGGRRGWRWRSSCRGTSGSPWRTTARPVDGLREPCLGRGGRPRPPSWSCPRRRRPPTGCPCPALRRAPRRWRIGPGVDRARSCCS